MILDPRPENYQDFYRLLIGAMVPRPIAFVSTVSPDGVRNLAPFSFFTAISANPPVICFCPMRRPGALPQKDTLHNIATTREFVVNIVSEEFAEKMNICSGEFPPDVDEFAASGLTPVASDFIRPPRVAESHVQMECRLYLSMEIGEMPGSGNLVLGEVIRMHVDDRIMDEQLIDPDKLRAIGRMGGNSYARTSDRFDLIRPKV